MTVIINIFYILYTLIHSKNQYILCRDTKNINIKNLHFIKHLIKPDCAHLR